MIRSSPRQRGGFTLIEIVISVTILVFILLIVTSFINTVAATWTSSDQRTSTFQDGRAILDLVSRDLAHASMSPALQFVVTSNIANTRARSDSIFWQAPLSYRVAGSATALTSLCEVGYYIDSNYNLNRFFSQPADTNFKIFTGQDVSDTSADWATNYMHVNGAYNIIATGIVAFWVRCFDANGDLIAWSGNTGTGGGGAASTIHYNSAAHFRPATLGSANSFTYTAGSTARGHLLPNVVELTIVLIDDKTLRKSSGNPNMIPAMPTVSSAAGIPAAISSFNTSLITNKVTTARTFTSRVAIPNSVRQ